MNIQSLSKMEQVVNNNKFLSWDGWTVVHSKKDPVGWSKTNGAFKNSQWYVQNRYEPTQNGWDLPSNLVR